MFNAFISYSHSADDKFASALQDALQKFAKPWYKKRNLEIFRDESSLSASPHLWGNITKALDQSEYLILLASSLSENSKWVDKEVGYWLERKSIDTILIALTDGEMIWDNQNNRFLHPDNNSLPPSLDDKFENEPFYIDLRQSKTYDDLSLNNSIFKKEILKLAAILHGKAPNDLASEEVSIHKKMITLRNGEIGTLSLLFIAAVGLGIFANTQRKEAENQTKAAEISAKKAMESDSLSQIETRKALYSDSVAQEERDNAIGASVASKKSDSLAQIEKDIAVKQAATSRALLLNFIAKDLLAKGWKTEALRVAEMAFATTQKASVNPPTPLLALLGDAFYSDNPLQLQKF